MVVQTHRITRSATSDDRKRLSYLVHFETFVHRHLDYRPPLDWIGNTPFPILEQGNEIISALACPPDPPQVAWIRFFATVYHSSVEQAWQILWPIAYAELQEQDSSKWVAAIPMQQWFTSLLEKSHFQSTHSIVMLCWERSSLPDQSALDGVKIRPMRLEDLSDVWAIDEAAFVPIWQNSQPYLEIAFRQATIATIVEQAGRLVGYQISTATPMGGHLARLAIYPQHQGKGLGSALLGDLLTQFGRRGARNITVNTQKDNLASLALYKKAGFRLTGEEYPVYQLAIR